MRRLKRISIVLIIFVLLFVTACSSNENVEETNGDDVITGDASLLTEPNNKLGFELLQYVELVEDNIFISPYSAFAAILLAYNAAEGETKVEMAESLYIDDISLDEVNGAMLALTKALQKNDENITMTVVNSIWLNDVFHFNESYSKQTERYFDAINETINIDDDASVDKMNDWVKEATNEKITDMVKKPLHPDFIAMILNAIYFNGKWQYPFDEANTMEDAFFVGNEELTVPFMMLEEDELAYMENELFQAVQLPYGSGEMNMQIFLPNEKVDLASFSEQLTEENWRIWNSEFRPLSGVVKLPKFQIEYETSLNEALQQLGMNKAFDEQLAQFPNMIEEDERIFIHEVKQKTYIEVTEEGTEAAGATSVEMRLTSAIIDEETFYMEINRPFFFTITDEETNVILFIGMIQNPTQ